MLDRCFSFFFINKNCLQVNKQKSSEADEEGLDQPIAVYDEEGV